MKLNSTQYAKLQRFAVDVLGYTRLDAPRQITDALKYLDEQMPRTMCDHKRALVLRCRELLRSR